MSTPQIRFYTKDFRAISLADINLNGISVVCGENGCGKSTLSRLLYFIYKNACNYEELVAEELRIELSDIERFLEIVISEIHSVSNKRNTREEFLELRAISTNSHYIDETDMERWISLVERIENNYSSQSFLKERTSNENSLLRINERLKYIAKDILDGDEISFNGKLPFKKVADIIKLKYLNSLEKVKSRPTELLIEELVSFFSPGEMPIEFAIDEFGEQIVSIKKKFVSIPYLIENCIYIGGTSLFSILYPSSETINYDLIELLSEKGKTKYSKLSNIISDEIIGGSIAFDDSSFQKFLFKRNDGETFNLDDCATGIKSFAILQLLINNGLINEKTLMIIDEPESNLHPQWIIEYARMIVLINKQIGTKFFLASHNPDMVSAIKYISEKEGVDSTLNFYLAEKKSNTYKYDYLHLGTDIEPIFASFNIALDRINKYGV